MFCPGCGGEYRASFSRCADCELDLVPEPPPSSASTDRLALATAFVTGDLALLAQANSLLDGAGISYLARGEGRHDLLAQGRLDPGVRAEPMELQVRAGECVRPPPVNPGNPLMQVAALYDIHGNLPALEAVLQEVRQAGVDLIVVGGDVLPGPMPRETLTVLRELELPVRFLHGNGESELLAMRAGAESGALPAFVRELLRWVAGELDPELEAWLASWPATVRVEIPRLGDVLFCHATPRNDTEIFTRLTPEDCLLPVFAGIDAPLVVCGHTHMQFERTIGGVRVVNAGSVGMPFGEPGADWLLLGEDVELRHTGYDLAAAAARIRATRYPRAEDFAARNVLQPPAAAVMLEAFTRAGLK
jgi:putative phosphoesterase